MVAESPPQLPGPTVPIVGFASEKHDSFERLPGHRHGAGETDFLSCAHGASAAQFGRVFYMEGRQAQYRLPPILPLERAEIQWQSTIQESQALPGPSGQRGVGVSRGGKAPLAAFW